MIQGCAAPVHSVVVAVVYFARVRLSGLVLMLDISSSPARSSSATLSGCCMFFERYLLTFVSHSVKSLAGTTLGHRTIPGGKQSLQVCLHVCLVRRHSGLMSEHTAAPGVCRAHSVQLRQLPTSDAVSLRAELSGA